MPSRIPDHTFAEITALYFLYTNTGAGVFTGVRVFVAPVEPFRTGETTPSRVTITGPGVVIARPILTSRVRHTFSAIGA